MQWSPLFPELYIINKWWHRNKLSRVIFFVQFKIYVCLHLIWFIFMIFSWKLQKQNKKEKIKLKTSKPSIHVPFTVRLCTNKNLSNFDSDRMLHSSGLRDLPFVHINRGMLYLCEHLTFQVKLSSWKLQLLHMYVRVNAAFHTLKQSFWILSQWRWDCGTARPCKRAE